MASPHPDFPTLESFRFLPPLCGGALLSSQCSMDWGTSHGLHRPQDFCGFGFRAGKSQTDTQTIGQGTCSLKEQATNTKLATQVPLEGGAPVTPGRALAHTDCSDARGCPPAPLQGCPQFIWLSSVRSLSCGPTHLLQLSKPLPHPQPEQSGRIYPRPQATDW